MSQSDKPEPPKENPTSLQAMAAQWARTCIGWIPGSSYIIGSTPPTSSPQAKVEEAEEREQEDEEVVTIKTGKETATEEPPKTESEKVGATEPKAEEESREAEKEEEKPKAKVVSEDDQAEKDRLKVQTEKVEALRKKHDGVASKLIAFLGRLKDYKGWSETPVLAKQVSNYRADLKKSLGQSHQDIARESKDIEAKLDGAAKWAEENTTRLEKLIAPKAELAKEMQALLSEAKKTAARGDKTDQTEVAEEVKLAETTTEVAFAALDFDGVRAEIKRFKAALKGIGDLIGEKFTDFEKRVANLEKGEYAKVHGEASSDNREDLETALAKAKAPGTLPEKAKWLEDLQSDIKLVRKSTAEQKKALQAYPAIEAQYESVRSIDPTAATSEQNEKTLKVLQKHLQTEWTELQEYKANKEWDNFSACVLGGRFPKLLADALKLVASDGEAAKAIEAARIEAERIQKEADDAAKLLEQEQREAAMAQRAAEKEAALEEGDRLFAGHSSKIIKGVWKVTRKHAPAAINTSIGGTYSLAEINAAIDAWGTRVDVGPFTRTFVPGGGAIQDKREKDKSRNEIQANFISDWEGNMINVHVNLRESDWLVLFPDRDRKFKR